MYIVGRTTFLTVVLEEATKFAFFIPFYSRNSIRIWLHHYFASHTLQPKTPEDLIYVQVGTSVLILKIQISCLWQFCIDKHLTHPITGQSLGWLFDSYVWRVWNLIFTKYTSGLFLKFFVLYSITKRIYTTVDICHKNWKIIEIRIKIHRHTNSIYE